VCHDNVYLCWDSKVGAGLRSTTVILLVLIIGMPGVLKGPDSGAGRARAGEDAQTGAVVEVERVCALDKEVNLLLLFLFLFLFLLFSLCPLPLLILIINAKKGARRARVGGIPAWAVSADGVQPEGLVQGDVVVAGDDELEGRVDGAQRGPGCAQLMLATAVGEVAAVEGHVRTPVLQAG